MRATPPTSGDRHEDRSSSRSPPGADEKREKRRSVSVSSDSTDEDEPRRKSRREDDTISVHATDDHELLAESPVHATVTDKPADASEDELLKKLVEALQDEDKKGPKVQQQLADIAIKRWGNKLNPEKITSILGKHPQPENCEAMAIARVNPEIWAPLNAAACRTRGFRAFFPKARTAKGFAEAGIPTICSNTVSPSSKHYCLVTILQSKFAMQRKQVVSADRV